MKTVSALVRRSCLFSLSSLLSLLPLALVACSSSPASSAAPASDDSGAPPFTGSDASADAHDASPAPVADAGGKDSGPEVIDAGPSCNALTAAAPAVSYALSNASLPVATGGTIVDGTYYLTGYTIYGAGTVDQGFTANQATSVTLVIAGGSWSQVQVYLIEGTTSTVSANFAETTSDTAIALTPSCPEGAVMNGTYTATPTAIQLLMQSSGFLVSETFALQ